MKDQTWQELAQEIGAKRIRSESALLSLLFACEGMHPELLERAKKEAWEALDYEYELSE